MFKVNYDVVILDEDAILEYDYKTGNIKIDKSIFNCFVKDSLFVVHFSEDSHENRIFEYKMISEDEKSITMEFFDKYHV